MTNGANEICSECGKEIIIEDFDWWYCVRCGEYLHRRCAAPESTPEDGSYLCSDCATKDDPGRKRFSLASGVGITCGKCGHVDEFDAFQRTPVAGALPDRDYQCPKCGFAIRKVCGPGSITPAGQEIPGDITLKPIHPYL